MNFWPVYFFKNYTAQPIEYSVTTAQDSAVATGVVPVSAEGSNKKPSLFPVPLSVSPRKNPGFCFRMLAETTTNAAWSDPPVVVGPQTMKEGTTFFLCMLIIVEKANQVPVRV